MAAYGPDDILLWEERLESALQVNGERLQAWMASERCSVYMSDTRDVKKALFMLQLLRLGAEVEETEGGFLVNDSIVLAVTKPEFRRKDEPGWTAYQDLGQLLASSMGRDG